MTVSELIDLLRVLSWPAVVILSVLLMRRELRGLFGRVRAIEGPGSLRVSLDAMQVEQILAEARQQNAPVAAIAERIVKAAVVVDPREARILRALVDDDGRKIYNYQSEYYRPALESLLSKGFVGRFAGGFALRQEGRRVTRDYLLGVLKSSDVSTGLGRDARSANP